jgi:hypothetical protein
MDLDEAHRRYLIIEQGVGSVIVNILINGTLAYFMFRAMPLVPLWGQQSIAGDLLGTCFFLPFFTCLIVTPVTHAAVRTGRFGPPGWARGSHPWLGRLPGGTLARAFVLGLIVFVLLGPLSVWVLTLLGVSELRFWPFVTFKALYAGALAAPVTPLIALCALGDSGSRLASHSSPPRAAAS